MWSSLQMHLMCLYIHLLSNKATNGSQKTGIYSKFFNLKQKNHIKKPSKIIIFDGETKIFSIEIVIKIKMKYSISIPMTQFSFPVLFTYAFSFPYDQFRSICLFPFVCFLMFTYF